MLVGHLGFNGHAGGERLEDRARLVAFHQRLVPPLRLPCLGQGRGLFIPGQLGYLGGQIRIADSEWIVGIVVPLDGHGQDAAGVDVLDNHRAPVGAARFPDRDFQILFRKGLNVGVDGKNQAVAVLGIHDFGVFHIGGQLVAPAVLGGDDPPRLAHQVGVIRCLQPLQPGVVGAGEAQDVGQGVLQRVIPFVVRDDAEHTDELVVQNPLGHLFLELELHLGLDHLVLGVGLARLFVQLLPVHAQHLRQLIRDEGAHVPIGIQILDVFGRHDQLPHLG